VTGIAKFAENLIGGLASYCWRATDKRIKKCQFPSKWRLLVV